MLGRISYVAALSMSLGGNVAQAAEKAAPAPPAIDRSVYNGERTNTMPNGFMFMATFRVKFGMQERFMELMRTKGQEIIKRPGVIEWKIVRDDSDEFVFYVWEVYKDYDAFIAHVNNPGTKEADTTFAEVLVGEQPIKIQKFKSINSLVP